MTSLRTTHRCGRAVLVLGLLFFATAGVEAAPIKFNITDLGRVNGWGLDNDGNVIDSPIRNIVGTSPYRPDNIIDGTEDGRLLVIRHPPRQSGQPAYAFVYNPHSTRPWDGPEIRLGMADTKTSYGTDMNTQGEVVGTAEWGGIDGMRPFYAGADWVSLRQLQDLNDLIPADSGWKLTNAYSINDRDQILGQGVNPAGELTNFLLTPDQVPEPATWAVFGLAAAAFAYRRRRAG